MSDAADMIRLKTQRLRDKITEREDERWREIVEDYSGRGLGDSGALIGALCALVVENAREMADQLIPIYVAVLGVDLDLDDAAKKIKKAARDHFASRRERILGMHAALLETRTTIYQLSEQGLDTKLSAIRADLQIAVWDLKKSGVETEEDETSPATADVASSTREASANNEGDGEEGTTPDTSQNISTNRKLKDKLREPVLTAVREHSDDCRAVNGNLQRTKTFNVIVDNDLVPDGLELPRHAKHWYKAIGDIIEAEGLQ